MFKAGTVAGIISAQSLVHDTQKDMNKEDITDHKEKTAQHDQHESSTELTTGLDQ
jgi:hypothetical protein